MAAQGGEEWRECQTRVLGAAGLEVYKVPVIPEFTGRNLNDSIPGQRSCQHSRRSSMEWSSRRWSRPRHCDQADVNAKRSRSEGGSLSYMKCLTASQMTLLAASNLSSCVLRVRIWRNWSSSRSWGPTT